jgi:hypothetical protein
MMRMASLPGTMLAACSPMALLNLAARLQSFGSSVEVVTYPGVGHIGILLSLAPGFRWKTTLRRDIVRFVMTQ